MPHFPLNHNSPPSRAVALFAICIACVYVTDSMQNDGEGVKVAPHPRAALIEPRSVPANIVARGRNARKKNQGRRPRVLHALGVIICPASALVAQPSSRCLRVCSLLRKWSTPSRVCPSRSPLSRLRRTRRLSPHSPFPLLAVLVAAPPVGARTIAGFLWILLMKRRCCTRP